MPVLGKVCFGNAPARLSERADRNRAVDDQLWGVSMRILFAFLLVCFGMLQPGVAAADSHSDAAISDEDAVLALANEPWKGDLDGILERGFLRLATANSPLYFSADGLDQRGLAVEIAREFEDFLDKAHPKKGRHVRVILMPMARDEILQAVIDGRADVAAANLTITAERSGLVAFSEPTTKDIREIVITGPDAPKVMSLDDLVETKLYLRQSSSYFEHLEALNEKREAEGKSAIPVETMDEYLEDYDLLEMVDAGILPAIVVDSHKVKIWKPVFDNITLHEDLFINDGGEIGWAIRKDSPKFLSSLNEFIDSIRKGTLLGNVLIKRYIKNPKWIGNVRSETALSRYEETLEIIRRYADEYDFDWLMITAQGYQESGLDQSKKSNAGAIGIMQVLPTTAKDPSVNIPDISTPENNVHAGVRYLRWLRSTYYDDPEIAPVDRVLFAFAAYNAGPGNMKKARRRAEKLGLDPDVWFNNVEIGAAKAISREPVIYVRNIYKYYIAYKLLEQTREARETAVEEEESQ